MSTAVHALQNRDAVSASRYRVIAKLGQGGMADVFLAIQSGLTGFRRLSVVKRVRSDIAADDDCLEMFLEEARLAARLNHPNVVHTYEVGHDGDSHFISMEFLRGHSYQQLLKRVGRAELNFAYSVRILIEALKGLEYAHQLRDFDGTPLRIVHRDVSPSNIFITSDGRIKILDFGIAKAFGSSVETKSGVLKGKIAYMSPEQASGLDIGAQSDLYAVGVMLWEAAAGKRRWPKRQEVAILSQLIRGDAPIPPGATLRGLPPEVDALCLKALATKPEDRFASAAEFQRALEGLLQHMGYAPSAEEVGAYLADCFRQEDEQLQHLIETMMKQWDQGEDLTIASLVSLKGADGSSGESSSVSLSREARPSHPTSTRIEPTELELPFEDGSRKTRRLAGIAAGALTLIITSIGTWALLRSDPPPPAPAAEVEAPPQPVSIRIEATPASAKLYWNGRLLEANPHIAELEPSKETVTLRAEADGYVAQSALFSLDADRDLTFKLEPMPEAPAPEKIEPEPEESKPSASSTPRRASKSTRTTPKPAPKPAPSKSTSAKVKLDTSNPWTD